MVYCMQSWRVGCTIYNMFMKAHMCACVDILPQHAHQYDSTSASTCACISRSFHLHQSITVLDTVGVYDTDG